MTYSIYQMLYTLPYFLAAPVNPQARKVTAGRSNCCWKPSTLPRSQEKLRLNQNINTPLQFNINLASLTSIHNCCGYWNNKNRSTVKSKLGHDS